MNAPALSETIGSGLNVVLEKIESDSTTRWKASVGGRDDIKPVIASSEQEAVQRLNASIQVWMGGNRV